MAMAAPQNSFTGGEWAPSLWARSDLQKYPTAVKTLQNFIIHPHGGISNRAGTYFVGETKFSAKVSRLIPFQFSTVQSYMLEFGDLYMRVFKDGGRVMETAKNITAIALGSEITVTSAAHGFLDGDWLLLSDIGGTTELNGKMVVVSDKTTDTFKLKDVDGNYIDGTAYTTYTSGGTAERVYELTTTYAEADLALLKIVQSADTLYVFHPSYKPRKITRTGHTSWTITDITWTPGIAAPTGLSATGGTGTYYVVTAVAEDGEESLPSAEVQSAASNTLNWTAVSGADYYNVYVNNNGMYGWLGYAGSNTYKIPASLDPDMTEGAPRARTPFATSGNYPGVGAFFEQRLVPARTNNNPQTIFGSVTGSFENMNVRSPLREDDAYTFTINSQRMNEIRWLVPLDVLLIGTSGGEWRMQGGKNSNGVTPTSVDLKQQSQWGCSHIQPLVIGSTVLFIDGSRRVARDLMYSLEVDRYTGNDLTVLANHLFALYKIKAWCYQQHPDSIIWCVRDDGTLVGLTYYREHEVWGWHRHETQGLFEDVASVTSDEGETDCYAIVQREVDGVDRRYIELFADRTTYEDVADYFFVDCGLTYDGAPATEISGLEHLEGMAVVAFADGNVVKDLTVIDGKITLANAASKVHVGLAYSSYVETLDFEYQTQEGTVQDKKRTISSAILGLKDTRALSVGPSSDRLLPIPFRTDEDYGDPIVPFTGDKAVSVEPNADWRKACLCMQNTDPVPVTILNVIPRMTHGEN